MVHVALFYCIGIIRALHPMEAVRLVKTIFLPVWFQTISALVLNHLSHTITRLRKPMCKAGGRSAQATQASRACPWPRLPWLLSLPSPHWDLRGWFSSHPYQSGPSRWHIKRIMRIKLQPCLGSGTKWEGCAFQWPVQHNGFPWEALKKNLVAWVPPPEMLT